ncbi:hypothetical protein MRB53_030377 [Persea americana]|uniref:Uncharacterized protein n=1 Tax=Persea americana TaxID=3435 RepID=A0ACC2KL59_PERAE|nr:hypothetical protein MRB53_030377 [Persea americana]
MASDDSSLKTPFNKDNTLAKDDYNGPFYLHPSDNCRNILVSRPFVGFVLWKWLLQQKTNWVLWMVLFHNPMPLHQIMALGLVGTPWFYHGLSTQSLATSQITLYMLKLPRLFGQIYAKVFHRAAPPRFIAFNVT